MGVNLMENVDTFFFFPNTANTVFARTELKTNCLHASVIFGFRILFSRHCLGTVTSSSQS